MALGAEGAGTAAGPLCDRRWGQVARSDHARGLAACERHAGFGPGMFGHMRRAEPAAVTQHESPGLPKNQRGRGTSLTT